MKRAATALSCAALLACTAVEPPPAPLAGTRWQLLAIESMSDEVPSARPADPAHYTLEFSRDGRASFRLDCNRGHGLWQATPGPGREPGRVSGSLSFGPVASTRAMCAPGSLAPRLEKDLPHVRSFVLQDGRLHLSLMADGGILSWMPAP